MTVLHRTDGPLLVFGGIYSNLQALEALMAAARARGIGPENMLCTGGIIGFGADAEACARIMRSEGILAVAGNGEQQIGAGDYGGSCASGSDTITARRFEYGSANMGAGQRAWMEQMPLRLELELNGLRLVAFHASLEESNRFIFPSTPGRVKLHDIARSDCDGVLTGHSGLPFSQVIGGALWHNAGAIGMPANDGTPRGWFSILTPGAESRCLHVTHHPLDYDHEAAAEAMRDASLPEEYAQALSSGLWPSCEVMPVDDMKARGRPLEPGTLLWRAGDEGVAGWPSSDARPSLVHDKFSDPDTTASGERRARVDLEKLETLWINTGTLCNLACASCYIESTPRNDRLVYITPAEVRAYLDEIDRDGWPVRTIGFTGGEPFMNPGMVEMLEDCLSRDFDVMVLTNAMRPMRRFERQLAGIQARYGNKLTMRVSIDHYARDLHELERGPRTWQPAIEGLQWLAANGFRLHIAGRMYSGESEAVVRAGYSRLFASLGLPVDAADPVELVLFPEMDEQADVPEITESCWGILGKSPSDIMCSSSRMVVKRKGADKPAVLACTLLAYDEEFELGQTLKEAARPVPLNHPHCAKFCVLGGAACSR